MMLVSPFFLVLVIVFVALLLIWLIGAQTAARSGSTVRSNTEGWDGYTASVISTEVYRRKKFGWGVRVWYEYVINGEQYKDKDRVFVRQILTNKRSAEAAAVEYPAGKVVSIRVRPDKATRSEIEESDYAVDNARVFKRLNGAIAGVSIVLISAIVLLFLRV